MRVDRRVTTQNGNLGRVKFGDPWHSYEDRARCR
jgi:hypothetical protein